MLRQEGDQDVLLGARAHEVGAAGHLPEADHSPQVVERQAELRLLLHPHADGLALLGEVRALGRHVERVQQMSQRGSLPSGAIAASR